MIGKEEAIARQRFLVMNLLRIGGVLFVMLGIAIAQQLIAWPVPVGLVLIAIGLFDIFFLPVILARRWRSDRK